MIDHSAHMAAPAGTISMNVGMFEAADLAEKLSAGSSQEDSRHFRLNAYNLDRTSEWRRLFDIDRKL